MINHILQKLHLERYLNARIVLIIDLIVSVLASLASLILIRLLTDHLSYDISFAIVWLIGSGVVSFIAFLMLHTYRSIIRHSTLREVWKLCAAILLKELMLAIIVVFGLGMPLSDKYVLSTMLLDLMTSIWALVIGRVLMIVIYDMVQARFRSRKSIQRILVYGTSDKSISLVMRLQNSPHYQVAGFLTYGVALKDHTLAERPVYYFETQENATYVAEKFDIDAVLFSTYNDARDEQTRLITYCTNQGTKILMAPPIDEVIDGLVRPSVRAIKIEDLLGRPEIKISMDQIIANFKGKTILVTGAAGSIGSELCRQLATFEVKELVLFDNAETPMHNIRLELEEHFPELKFAPVIGDVRLKPCLDAVFRTYHPDVVFHAAAYKHVPLMEENPCESVFVNVGGTHNVADKCLEYNVEKMVMISTDKAVNPTNIMGCTKRLAEIYVQSLGQAIAQGHVQGKTQFVTTRFGNVLGSNGSVIPRFREQIANGGPVTVTHPDITRFFMTIPEACRLVMEAATMSTGTQIFVFDMGVPVRITQLARRMIELAGFEPDKEIKIEYTGLRPGEKLYEEVLANTENTLPTKHDRINIAKVREYNYEDAQQIATQLEALSRTLDESDMVRLMKRTVPEFKSQNSRFEIYDEEFQPAEKAC